MWQGWVSYGGNEIINVSRTETYAKWAQLPWFKPQFDADQLSLVLGDGPRYVSPLLDNAPWTDPDVAASYGFYGVYPLDITGAEDSTRSAQITESIGEGGFISGLRHGSKSVVFNAVLVAEDEAAAEYGFMWLKQALESGPCADGGCTGVELCYLTNEPRADLEVPGVDPSEIIVTPPPAPDITTTDLDGGVTTVAASSDVDGGVVTSISATDYDGGSVVGTVSAVTDSDGGTSTTSSGGTDWDGGTPSSSSSGVDEDGGGPSIDVVTPPGTGGGGTFVTVPQIENIEDCLPPLLRSLHKVVVTSGPSLTAKRETSDGGAVWTVTFTAVAGDPWVFGAEQPIIEGFLDPEVDVPWVGGVVPDGGYIDLDGFIYSPGVDGPECVTPVYQPLQDPDFPVVVPPPLPPAIKLGPYNPPANWRRRQITVPADYIPLWGEVVPTFQVHARDADVRNLRLRFYADVNADGDISGDPCAYCGDIVVSYIPHGSTFVFDAVERQTYVLDASQHRRQANAVVFATDGTPFEWPVLTCGFGYIVTLDLPQKQHPPVFDLSLTSRVA